MFVSCLSAQSSYVTHPKIVATPTEKSSTKRTEHSFYHECVEFYSPSLRMKRAAPLANAHVVMRNGTGSSPRAD
jgi:hypothetical protein